jgi:predicted Rossmann fold flavoprotein
MTANSSTPINYQVIIIGAGASGLMCAMTAAARGHSVLVLDHANKMGKKILMSGGGKCNFTNYSVEAENFVSDNEHFCKSALSRYTQWDFIALVDKHNIEYEERSHGQLFCIKSAKDIRDLLLKECQTNGAKIQLKCDIQKVKSINNDYFQLETSLGKYQCKSLVIATGALSIPTMGASGIGYEIGRQFGHNILPTSAGLSPLTFSGKRLQEFQQLAGNSMTVEVTCKQATFKEAMLFTHKGLSGPVILQISNYWTKGEPIHINLLPELDAQSWLAENINNRPEINLKTLLATQFSQSIASYFVEQLGIDIKLKQIEHKQQSMLSKFLQCWTIYPDDVEGYRVAEVTLGGLDTAQVSSKTFESKCQPNLYFIGEVLDVTGHLGGFNFQWAWASGYAAGSHVS